MADLNFIPGDLRVGGQIIAGGNITTGGLLLPGVPRSSITQTVLAEYPILLTEFRIWDALQTPLTGTAGTDDLGLIGGTFATSPPSIRTSDADSTTVTQYARVLVRLPAEYDAGQTVQFRVSAGMITNAADTSATLDIEAWEVDSDNTLGASDLVTTAATSINNTTFADKDFTLTSTNLVAGDLLDVRVTIAITDGSTGAAVIGAFVKFNLLCDIRG